jgi:hypothetical protein
MVGRLTVGMVAGTAPEWHFCVTSSAGGSQDKEHFLGYPLHVSFPVWAADNEVESGEAEAEEVP